MKIRIIIYISLFTVLISVGLLILWSEQTDSISEPNTTKLSCKKKETKENSPVTIVSLEKVKLGVSIVESNDITDVYSSELMSESTPQLPFGLLNDEIYASTNNIYGEVSLTTKIKDWVNLYGSKIPLDQALLMMESSDRIIRITGAILALEKGADAEVMEYMTSEKDNATVVFLGGWVMNEQGGFIEKKTWTILQSSKSWSMNDYEDLISDPIMIEGAARLVSLLIDNSALEDDSQEMLFKSLCEKETAGWQARLLAAQSLYNNAEHKDCHNYINQTATELPESVLKQGLQTLQTQNEGPEGMQEPVNELSVANIDLAFMASDWSSLDLLDNKIESILHKEGSFIEAGVSQRIMFYMNNPDETFCNVDDPTFTRIKRKIEYIAKAESTEKSSYWSNE